MKILFKIREFAWVVVSEIEDWLYPYRNQLTPEEQFEIRVKDPMSGENFMVEEHIQSINERIERLQDEMINVQMKLSEHDDRFKTKVKIKKDSSSVSGDIKNIFNS
jgi:predicted  nucleic acid-binding Zn-ribbon protein